MKQLEGQWRDCGWGDLQHAHTIPQPRPQWPKGYDWELRASYHLGWQEGSDSELLPSGEFKVQDNLLNTWESITHTMLASFSSMLCCSLSLCCVYVIWHQLGSMASMHCTKETITWGGQGCRKSSVVLWLLEFLVSWVQLSVASYLATHLLHFSLQRCN